MLSALAIILAWVGMVFLFGWLIHTYLKQQTRTRHAVLLSAGTLTTLGIGQYFFTVLPVQVTEPMLTLASLVFVPVFMVFTVAVSILSLLGSVFVQAERNCVTMNTQMKEYPRKI